MAVAPSLQHRNKPDSPRATALSPIRTGGGGGGFGALNSRPRTQETQAMTEADCGVLPVVVDSDVSLGKLVMQSQFYLPGDERLNADVVTCKHGSLWVVFEDTERKDRFPLSCFSLSEHEHLTHEARDEHTARVTALVCHERAAVTMTASLDGTVRFWDPRNSLVLRCEVSTPVHACCFHPTRFTAIMSVHRQLHELEVLPHLENEGVVRFRALGVAAASAAQQHHEGSSDTNNSCHDQFDDRHRGKRDSHGGDIASKNSTLGGGHFGGASVESSSASLLSPVVSDHVIVWQETERYGAESSPPLLGAGSTVSTAAPGRSFNLNATMDLEQLQRDEVRAKERSLLEERQERIDQLLHQRERARNVTVSPQNSRKERRRALRQFVRAMHPPNAHVVRIKAQYTSTVLEKESPLTPRDVVTLRNLAKAFVEEGTEPSPLHAQSIARRQYPKRLPIAPDGSIPNSSVWKALLQEGVKEQSAPAEFHAAELSDEQRRALELMQRGGEGSNGASDDDDDDDDDENGMMALLSQPLEDDDEDDGEEEEEEEEDSADEAERAMLERMERQRRRRLDEERQANNPTEELVSGFARRQNKHGEDEDEVVEEEPEDEIEDSMVAEDEGEQEEADDDDDGKVEDAEPTYPPLPRYLTQFRDRDWFKHHFPRAVPATFNHIRPRPDPVSGEQRQIGVADVVTLLASTTGLGPAPAANVVLEPGQARGLLFCTGDQERQRTILKDLGILSRHPEATHEDHEAIKRSVFLVLAKVRARVCMCMCMCMCVCMCMCMCVCVCVTHSLTHSHTHTHAHSRTTPRTCTPAHLHTCTLLVLFPSSHLTVPVFPCSHPCPDLRLCLLAVAVNLQGI